MNNLNKKPVSSQPISSFKLTVLTRMLVICHLLLRLRSHSPSGTVPPHTPPFVAMLSGVSTLVLSVSWDNNISNKGGNPYLRCGEACNHFPSQKDSERLTGIVICAKMH